MSVERVVIVGAGGHAQVTADVLLAMQRAGCALQVVAFVDDSEALRGKRLLDVPVLGGTRSLETIEHDAVMLGIGDNRTRFTMSARFRACGERLARAVHPSAVIGHDVEIGAGTLVCAGVVVNTGARIGSGVILNTGCTVDHHCVVGDAAHVAPGSHLGGAVVVGEGALVGIGAAVTPQRRIGDWSIVGAGAAVIRDVPDGVTVVGVPARPIEAAKKQYPVFERGDPR